MEELWAKKPSVLIPLVAALAAVLVVAIVALVSDSRGAGYGHGMMSRESQGTMVMPMSVRDEAAFLVEMSAHHEEAVSVAGQLRRSDRNELRDFGFDIVAVQSEQIAQMSRWLREWYPDRAEYDAEYRPMMRNLSGLSGDDLARVFLEDMIAHHMMAVMMSQQFLVRGLAEHAEVGELARSIRDDQLAEVAQMRGWLADWFDGAAPYVRHVGMGNAP
jgi:uncharacterized protein (DUF305 family)